MPISHKTNAVAAKFRIQISYPSQSSALSLYIQRPRRGSTNIPNARRKLRPFHRFPNHREDTLERQPLSNNSRICANGVREESNLGEPRIANRMLLHSALIDPMPAISFGIRVPAFILCSHKQWLCSMAKVTLVISNPTAG